MHQQQTTYGNPHNQLHVSQTCWRRLYLSTAPTQTVRFVFYIKIILLEHTQNMTCTSKHRLCMFIQFADTFGINVSHNILERRIVIHMVLEAHGMPCELFIQICWTRQTLSMYYRRSQIKSHAARLVCFKKSSTNTTQMAEPPKQQSHSNDFIAGGIANCNKLSTSCQLRLANLCNDAAAAFETTI